MERPTTLTELIEATAAARPGVAAFGGRMGWAEAAEAIRCWAGALEQAGIGPGDRVAIFAPNRPDFLLLLFALARRGACAVLLNTRFRAGEIGNLLARAAPTAIAVSRDFGLVDAAAVLAGVPGEERASLRLAIGLDALPDRSFCGLPVLTRAALMRGPGAADLATPDADCLTFTTSGTTAGPKLVLHRQASIAGHAADVAARIGTAAADAALLAAVPLCGTFGLAAALAAVAGGASVLCLDRLDAGLADGLIRAHGVTHMVGGDEWLLKLAEAANGQPYAPLAFTGFASFHGQAEKVIAASDALNLGARGVYGSSEAQALFALQDDAHRATGGGTPASEAASYSIAGDGELCLRGPSLFHEYLGNPAATAQARTGDGWFRSGDLASAQSQGFAFVTRRGDALRLGGFLVSPEEIESFLQAQPGVSAAQVVESGGKPVAFVIAGAGFDAAAVIAAAKDRLAGFKVPARIVTLDAFPVTDGPNGPKIQRAQLRMMA